MAHYEEAAVGPYPEERPAPIGEPFFDDFVKPRKRSSFPTGAGEDSGPLPGAAFVSSSPPLSRVQTEEGRTRSGDPAVVADRRTRPGTKDLTQLLELVL